MSFRQTPHRNPLLTLVVLIVCATAPATAQQDTTTCTPAPSSQSALSKAGYRIASIRWDPLLSQRWAKLVSCAHPERPAIAMLMPSLKQIGAPSTSAAAARQTAEPFVVVHAGDLVRLWSQEGNLHIEASGIAEANGATGSTVRVRLLHSGLDGQYQEQTFQGVVRGPRDVEMQR
jgi:hypothetical protein